MHPFVKSVEKDSAVHVVGDDPCTFAPKYTEEGCEYWEGCFGSDLYDKCGGGPRHVADDCACTGNMGKGAQQEYYPKDIGNSCSAWDGGMDYCLEGGSSYGEDWCPSAWCYAPESCEGSAKGSYLSDYDGPDLYYNYDLCGAEDTYTGTDSDPLKDCACTGNMGKGSMQDYYPAEIGNECSA